MELGFPSGAVVKANNHVCPGGMAG